MTRNTRIALLAAAAVVAVVAIVIIGSGGDDGKKESTTAAQTSQPATTQGPATTAAPPPEPAIQVITLKNGKPVGGLQKVTVSKSDRVRFRVVSDAAHKVHVHGFDIIKDVPAGGSVSFDFKGDAPGIYEVELEDTSQEIAEIKVQL